MRQYPREIYVTRTRGNFRACNETMGGQFVRMRVIELIAEQQKTPLVDPNGYMKYQKNWREYSPEDNTIVQLNSSQPGACFARRATCCSSVISTNLGECGLAALSAFGRHTHLTCRIKNPVPFLKVPRDLRRGGI